MFICFALLVDYKISNYARKIVYDITNKYGASIEPALLPQHISLKQSFKVNSIDKIESYFDNLADSLKSFDLEFSKINLIEVKDNENDIEILWLDVNEIRYLRDIHNRLNKELLEKFEIPKSGFDGENFHFHSTLSFGYNQKKDFKEIKRELCDKDLNLRFTVKEIALFYSPDDECIQEDL
ncbi:2'-5' RNA ligase family protein [Clostridium sp. Marseille-QA1073]